MTMIPPEGIRMSPLRFLLTISGLTNIRRVRSSSIWVSDDWLAEHRAKEYAVRRQREGAADLSTLVSERLSLTTDEDE